MEQATFSDVFEAKVRPVIEQVEAETKECFLDWYHPLQGEMVEEFTDIRWVAVQMLLYWADDTGSDVQLCFREFLRSFQAEMNSMRETNWPLPEGTNKACFCGSGKAYSDCCEGVEEGVPNLIHVAD